MRIPKPVAGRDVRSLPLAPLEGYVLSRVDGIASEAAIVAATGLGAEAVAVALERLAALGAVELDGAHVSGSRPLAGSAAPSSPSAEPPPVSAARVVTASSDRAAAPAAPGDEKVDIDPAKRARILELFGKLGELSHYELLGVTQVDQKKEIKSAYYQLAPEFHPDRYFRKELGSFKQKIEAIFTRVTLAHDVLTVKEKRAEYDEYLEQTQQNRALAALLDDSAPLTPPPPAAVPTPPPAPPTPAPAAPVTPAPARPIDRAAMERDRREILARKLVGGRGLVARAASAPPAPRSSAPPAQPSGPPVAA
ncbi:MAG TPA: DnaJ domain-containing protein, partial [Byssovorax sp.]